MYFFHYTWTGHSLLETNLSWVTAEGQANEDQTDQFKELHKGKSRQRERKSMSCQRSIISTSSWHVVLWPCPVHEKHNENEVFPSFLETSHLHGNTVQIVFGSAKDKRIKGL